MKHFFSSIQTCIHCKEIIFIFENANAIKFTKLMRKSIFRCKTGNTEYVCERGENEGRDTIVKMANFCRTIFVYCKNQRFKFQTCCFCMLIFEQKKRKCNTVLKFRIFPFFQMGHFLKVIYYLIGNIV